jgi:hypothetical protein
VFHVIAPKIKARLQRSNLPRSTKKFLILIEKSPLDKDLVSTIQADELQRNWRETEFAIGIETEIFLATRDVYVHPRA